jgi:predicted amidohydrolase
MQEISITYKIEIFLSMIWKENNCFTNRAFYINGDDFTYYDKVHLFAPGGESLNFKAGEERKVIKTVKGISILPLICYDLRFPEISRNKGDIDVIIYMSSWPETRTYHWDTLLKARAIENQCYVLGVNRIGKDGNQLNYIGHSNLIDYYGNEVAIIRNNENSRQKISIAHLDFHKMYAYRNKLPFLRDIM